MACTWGRSRVTGKCKSRGTKSRRKKSSKRKGTVCKVVRIKGYSVRGRSQKMCWNSKGRLVSPRRAGKRRRRAA